MGALTLVLGSGECGKEFLKGSGGDFAMQRLDSAPHHFAGIEIR
jgi:hypothetical protein